MIAAARERGLPVLGELELAWRLLPNRFVAVTGTNGKTTTVELLGRDLARGRPAGGGGGQRGHAAGLAGGQLGPDATVVCEVSSFQLEDALAFAPDTALLLNLSEDHLDRHGSFEAYREAKLRVFAHQRPEQVAVAPPGFGELPGAARRVSFGDPAELPLPAGGDPPARRRTTSRTRWAPRRPRWPRACRPRRWPRRCAASPACRTASRRWAAWAACST